MALSYHVHCTERTQKSSHHILRSTMGSGDLSFKIAISAIDFKSLQGFSWYFNHVVGDYVSYEMIKDLEWVVK